MITTLYAWINKKFIELLELLKKMLPTFIILPNNKYEAKRILLLSWKVCWFHESTPGTSRFGEDRGRKICKQVNL